jgi:hypothetical protein
MIDTILLCTGCFVLGLGIGGLAGIAVQRFIERPEVTPWGESTALWSDVDWSWYYEQGDRRPHG